MVITGKLLVQFLFDKLQLPRPIIIKILRDTDGKSLTEVLIFPHAVENVFFFYTRIRSSSKTYMPNTRPLGRMWPAIAFPFGRSTFVYYLAVNAHPKPWGASCASQHTYAPPIEKPDWLPIPFARATN